jgi:hypothetical protein
VIKSTERAFFKKICLEFLMAFTLTVLLAMPSMFASASSPVQQSTDASGVWDITVVDPGGWEITGEMRQKDAEGNWSDPTPVAVNGPGPSETHIIMTLSMNGDQITGTYKLEPQIDCSGINIDTGITSDSTAYKEMCRQMNSGDVGGSVKGDQLELKIGFVFSLQGTISGETMQGTGQYDMWKTGKYMKDADIPVTFSAARREGTSLVDCQVKISTPENLTPGDDLWVSATFTDPDGKEIVPKSHAYYINGKEITSVEWNGEAAQIEVQYTCPNNKTKTEKLTIPAYVAPKLDEEPEEKEKADTGKPPTDQEKQPADEKSEGQNAEENPGGVDLEKAATIAVVAGGMLTAVSGAVGAGLVIKALAEAAKGANLAKDAVAVVQAPSNTPPVEVQPEPQPTESSPPRSKAGDERITSAEKARLQQHLNNLEARQVELTHRQDMLRQVQQQVYRSRDRMQDFYKRNALRVILRLGFETHQYLEILYNPGKGAVELISQLTQEAVDHAIQAPPQGASDAEILENQRQNIRRLGDEIQNVKRQRYEAHVEQEKNLREMERIRNRLKNAVELPF